MGETKNTGQVGPPDGYDIFDLSGIPVLCCEACSALVADPIAHDEWHKVDMSWARP